MLLSQCQYKLPLIMLLINPCQFANKLLAIETSIKIMELQDFGLKFDNIDRYIVYMTGPYSQLAMFFVDCFLWYTMWVKINHLPKIPVSTIYLVRLVNQLT